MAVKEFPPKYSKGNRNRLNFIPDNEAEKLRPLQCQTRTRVLKIDIRKRLIPLSKLGSSLRRIAR